MLAVVSQTLLSSDLDGSDRWWKQVDLGSDSWKQVDRGSDRWKQLDRGSDRGKQVELIVYLWEENCCQDVLATNSSCCTHTH